MDGGKGIASVLRFGDLGGDGSVDGLQRVSEGLNLFVKGIFGGKGIGFVTAPTQRKSIIRPLPKQ